MIIEGSGCSSIHVHLGLLGSKTLKLKAVSSSYSTKLHYHSFLFFSSLSSVWSWFWAFIWQDTAAKGHRNMELVLHWTFLSTGQSIASAMGKQDLCSFFTIMWHGGFSVRLSTSSCSQKGKGSPVAIPYSKTGGISHKDLEGKCQIAAQSLNILMGSCALLRNMSLKCTPKCVFDQYPLLISRK